MKKNKYFTVIILLFGFLFSHAQEDLSVCSYWTYNGDRSNTLFTYICTGAFAQLQERWTAVAGLTTKEDWLNRQLEVKKMMAEIAGAFPAKTPLNPVITGTIKRDGFTVEKLYFESRPGYYVTAALFLPTVKKGKLPAIVYCCGHGMESFRSMAYQKTILTLVKKGFIVLAFDPVGQGERVDYFDPDGQTIYDNPTHQHSYPGTLSFISGRSPANYFIWDGIRAVDYLVSRKEVDPARIGMTGRSGGGTQTAYIAALDDRILAAAPECYITSFEKELRTIGAPDAEQVFLYALEKGFDKSDLIELRAPKPTLLVTTTQDIFSIQGARDVFREARNAFIALGEPDHLMMVEDDAGHVSTSKNREAIHAFFQHFLNHPGDPKDEEVELFEEKELWVTPAGQVQKSMKGAETLFSLNGKYTDEVLKKRQTEKQNNPDFYHELTQKAKSVTGYAPPVPSKDYLFSGRWQRDSYAIEKYLIKGPGNYYIPLLYLSSGRENGKTVLLIDDQGKEAATVKGGLADALAIKGYRVIVPDLNGYGELGTIVTNGQEVMMKDVPNYIWFGGVLTHKSPLAVRVEDLKMIVDFIKDSPFTGGTGPLSAIARGTLTTDLLHAAVINGAFDQIALINPLISYQSMVQEKNYHTKFIMSAVPGVLANYDLPDLVAALSPMKIHMINPVNALGQPVDNNTFYQTYSKNDSQNLEVVFNETDVVIPF